MPNTKTTVPFAGTPEQEKELRDSLARLKDVRGALMPALQKAQGIYGYLPLEVQKIVAEELGVGLSEVYGVVSFYSQFSVNPKGRYKISVCMGTACYVKGAADILEKISDIIGIKSGECTPDMKFSLEGCRCIGACGLAPVITVNEDVHGRLHPDDIPAIMQKYIDMD